MGMSDSRENLQKLIDVVHKFCNWWRLKANVIKCQSKVPGTWTWGEHTIPQASSYCYLGIDFTSDGWWDTHVKRVISNGRKKVNQLHSIISSRNLNPNLNPLLRLGQISSQSPQNPLGGHACVHTALVALTPMKVMNALATVGIGSNCPGISGTVSDFLPLSRVLEGLT